MTDDKEWRAIPRFDGYEASVSGRVRRVRDGVIRVLSQRFDAYGYRLVHVSVNGDWRTAKVHRLVLEAFVGPCPDGMVARHFPDRDRSNNQIQNLSWCTPKQNSDDKKIHGTMNTGDRNGARTQPWRVSRGDNHYTRRRPELRTRGAGHGRAKTTLVQVRQIKGLIRSAGVACSTVEIAEITGASVHVVRQIRSGKSWRHVP